MQLKIADRIKDNILPSTLGLFDIITENIENIPVIKIIIRNLQIVLSYLLQRGNITILHIYWQMRMEYL